MRVRSSSVKRTVHLDKIVGRCPRCNSDAVKDLANLRTGTYKVWCEAGTCTYVMIWKLYETPMLVRAIEKRRTS